MNFDGFSPTLNGQSVDQIFAGLAADRPEVKYGCMKLLRRLGEEQPARLYPHFPRFAALLDSDNTFLQWGAIIIIGDLAAVDAENQIDRLLDRYLEPIAGPVMITAANVIGGAAKIARAKPQLTERIARAILRAETGVYGTPECRNVVLGHAVKGFDLFFGHIREPQPVIAFVRRQLKNPRQPTRSKAAKFLQRHAPPDRE